MEEWGDWVVEDSDPAEMIQRMRRVLSDRKRSQEDKIEALSVLTNMADEASIAVLRWYNEHADPGMEVLSMLALMEADRLNQPPRFEPWHEELLETIHEVSEVLALGGSAPNKAHFQQTLARRLQDEGWLIEEHGHALLKYDGQLVDLIAVEMVVNGQVLIGFWDRGDEEDILAEYEFDEEPIDPFDHFYAMLRTANLPWGIQVDISGQGVLTDIVENIELDRGRPKVEYILSFRGAV